MENIKRYIRNNPRKSAVIGVYLLIFLSSVFVFHFTASMLILIYLIATMAVLLALRASALAVLGNYLYITGKTEKGIKFLKMAIDMNTPSPNAYINYSVFLARGGRGDEALAYLSKALEKNPDILAMKNIELTSASCHWLLGRPEKARDILEGMRGKYEYVNAQVLTTLGYMYFVLKDYEKALEFSNLALEDTPSLGAAWDNLGQIYLSQGKKGEAKDAFTKAIENKSDLPDSLYYLGLIAKDEGEAEKARSFFLEALACGITALNTVKREQIENALASLSI